MTAHNTPQEVKYAIEMPMRLEPLIMQAQALKVIVKTERHANSLYKFPPACS